MFRHSFFNDLWLILSIAFVEKEVRGECPTPECTDCSDTALFCKGLAKAPVLDYISGWRNIEQISFTNGNITFIPEGYFDLSNLEIIDLSHNKLTTFNMSSLSYASQLRTIKLTGNPITCNSNIDWLKKWKMFYPPGNRINGTCGGQDINNYLDNTSGSLVDIKVSNSSFVFGRSCNNITVQFSVIGNFDIPLEYKSSIHDQTRKTIFNVVTENITVPVGKNIFTVTIKITGGNEEDDALLLISSKYPVSYETNVEILLRNDTRGCKADLPINAATTQIPSLSKAASKTPISNFKDDETLQLTSEVASLTVRRDVTSSKRPTPISNYPVSPMITRSYKLTQHYDHTTIASATSQETTPRQRFTSNLTKGFEAASLTVRSDVTSPERPTSNAADSVTPAISHDYKPTPTYKHITTASSTSQATTPRKRSTTILTKGVEGGNGLTGSVPVLTATRKSRSSTQDGSPKIEFASMVPTDTTDARQIPFKSPSPPPVTLAKPTLASDISPTTELTQHQTAAKSPVNLIINGTASTLPCQCTESKDSLAIVVVLVTMVTTLFALIIAMCFYWLKRSRDPVNSTLPIKEDDVSSDNNETAV